MAKLNRRQKQLVNNLEFIFGSYYNGITDYGEEEYPLLTEEKAIDMAIPEIYNIKCDGGGWTRFGIGICKDLKFLGNNYIKSEVIRIAEECEVLV